MSMQCIVVRKYCLLMHNTHAYAYLVEIISKGVFLFLWTFIFTRYLFNFLRSFHKYHVIFAHLHENKGPFIYYVITFLGFLDPPPYVFMFLVLKIIKNWHFLTPPPPPTSDYVIYEWSLTKIYMQIHKRIDPIVWYIACFSM